MIYGAGKAFGSLANSLYFNNKYKILSFIDANKTSWGRSINKIPIKKTQDFFFNQTNVDFVVIAIPSISNKRKIEIFNFINKLGIKCLHLQNLNDLSNSKDLYKQIKYFTIEEILGRNSKEINFHYF